MAIPSELNRILPRFDETPTHAQSRDYLRFLSGLDRKAYEEVLRHLPDRLGRQGAVVKDEDAWDRFTDFLCFQAILNYTRFVMGSEIVRMLGSKQDLGSVLHRLALMMSEGARKRIVNELRDTEVRDCLAYLETYFTGDRVGMVDFAVEEILRGFIEEKGRKSSDARFGLRRPDDIGLSPKKEHDQRILYAIQDLRRRDAKRLPARPTTSNEVRFIAEEVHRELFSYPQRNVDRAAELIGRALDWYNNSQMFRSTRRGTHTYSIETGFFTDLLDVLRKISSKPEPMSFEGTWETILNRLRSEKFWHDIAGLNHDIPIEQTEAGRRPQVYQRAALAGGAIFAGLLLLPLAVRLTVAAPGAIVRVVHWTGSGLLLAAQYSYSTYKAYGIVAGTANMAREGYRFYLQNAVTINQRMADVVEFFLEIGTAGSGQAPGSSPADITRYVTNKMAVLTGRKEIPKLVSEARAATHRPDTKVDLVRVIVEDKDHKLYEVTTRVSGYQNDKIKVAKLTATDATGKVDDQVRKTITFFGTQKKGVDLIVDPRATRYNGVTATKVAEAEKAKSQAAPVDELALRKQKIDEQKHQEAQKLAENLAQKAALKELGERKVANAPDAVVIDMARKRAVQGGSDRAVLGRTTPAQGGANADVRVRSTGGANATPDSKALKDRATGSHLKSVPADPPPPAGTRLSPAGYWIIEDEALLKPLKRAGFEVEAIGLKAPKSGGGRFQGKHVSGSDAEWRVSSPGGVEADIDALAVDNLKRGGLVAVEAKATFVADAGKSAHLAFYPEKVEQLSRQLALCLESRGMVRLEIVANATSVAETYLNITAQQVARELRKQFAQQVKDFIKHNAGKTVKRLSLESVEQIVEDNVTVVLANWGKIKAAKKK